MIFSHRLVYFGIVLRQSYPRLTEISSMTIKTTRLALEVKEAIASDPLSGPASDRARHFIGIEYEIVLERELKNLGSFTGNHCNFCISLLLFNHTSFFG